MLRKFGHVKNQKYKIFDLVSFEIAIKQKLCALC